MSRKLIGHGSPKLKTYYLTVKDFSDAIISKMKFTSSMWSQPSAIQEYDVMLYHPLIKILYTKYRKRLNALWMLYLLYL
jgi:hypothetical protein